MRFIFLIIFFLLPLVSYPLDWKPLHEKAQKLILAEAQRVLDRQNPAAEDLYVLGLVYLNEYKPRQAENIFDKITGLDSKISEARWGKAESLRRRHQLEESKKILKEVIKSNPDFSPAYITLAYINFSQHNYNKAVELVYKVLKQGREKVDLISYTRAYLILAGSKGMIAHDAGPIAKVIHGTKILPNLRKAQELMPNSAGVHFGFGAFYLLAPTVIGGDINKAEESLKQAVRADPLFADVYVRLAQVYQRKGDIEKYKLYLEEALRLDSGNELALDIKNKICKFICF